MSTTEIYAVAQNGDVEAYSSARNSWLGGFYVWETLREKYEINESLMDFDKTWKNFNKGIYEKYEDIILGSTFDDVWIKKENFGKLIEAFSQFYKSNPNSNYSQQIEIIQKMQNDDDVIGIAWCQTSVCDDSWDFGYDEEKEKLIPYNIFKGKKHWELFEHMEESE